MRKIKLLLAVAILFLVSAQHAYGLNLGSSDSFSALDTVAHFETALKADALQDGQGINFSVIKPDGTVFKTGAIADSNGKAIAAIPDDETKVAGIYKVTSNVYPGTVTFKVFPGEMSARISRMYSTKEYVAANGADYAQVNVRITDEFSNALAFHEVKLVSNRTADKIVSISSETDENGVATFFVSSQEPGASTLSATDVTADTTVEGRQKIVFARAPGVYKAIGGDPQTILLAAVTPPSGFTIENMPATANINETLSFTVRAVDASSNTVADYTGQVTFLTTDPTSQSPAPYTFQVSDQGRKTFSLGLTFRTSGSQKLTVKDSANNLIKGEKSIEILAAAGNSGGQVRITKPATGTYSVKILAVEGEVTPNATVKIFDNGQQIAEVPANSSGRFSYTTALLRDGQHTFHIESNGVQSTPVTVTIDTTPAQIEDVQISRTELAPGDTFDLTIRTDPDINSIIATVGSSIIDLQPVPQNPGLYRGTLTAPAIDGQYTVNVVITDKLGNLSQPKEAGKIRVDSMLTGAASFSVPSKVQSVQAAPGNGRVNLTWSASQSDVGVALYRIYYGTDQNKLNLIVNTMDAKTTWYIPNLQNGTTYYFRVAGVDKNGNQGDLWSDMVNSAPSSSAVNAEEASQTPVLCEPGPCPQAGLPPTSPEDGPEVIGMVIAALLGGGAIKFFKKKAKLFC